MFWKKKNLDSEEYSKCLKRLLELQDEIGMLKLMFKDLEMTTIKALEFQKKYKSKLTKELNETKEEKQDLYSSVLLPE